METQCGIAKPKKKITEKEKNTSCSGALGRKKISVSDPFCLPVLVVVTLLDSLFSLRYGIRIIIICKIYVKNECFNVIRIFRLPFIERLLSLFNSFCFFFFSVVIFGFVFMMTASYLFSYKLQNI